MGINRQAYRSGQVEKLTADMVKGTRAVLTIAKAREAVPAKGKPFIVLQFEEFPHHEMNLNTGQASILMDCIDEGILSGEGFDKWAGVRIAFEKRENTNPTDGTKVTKLYPVAASLQVNALAEYDAFVEGKKAKAAKGSAK